MKKALYLDDIRTPTETLPGFEPWIVVRSYCQFVDWIVINGMPDFISFDHDLTDEHIKDFISQRLKQGYQFPDYDNYKEKTGLDCAKWLVEYCQNRKIPICECSIHSHNPVGANNIHSLINGYKKHMDSPQDCYIGKHPFTTEKQNTTI